MFRRIRTRRSDRHLLSTSAQAVALDRFELIGDKLLDCSAEGVLVACDREIELGQRVLISFAVPGSELWFDAETEVVRIVHGLRPGDRGYCAGLRFVEFDRRDRLALGVDLRAHPLTPRVMRWDHGEVLR